MDDLLARSPLEGREDDLARLGAHAPPIATQLAVRTRAPEALGLPIEPNTWSALAGADGEALWLGPDEWLVTSPSPWRDVAVRFGTADAVVNVSANRVAIELSRRDGRDPRALLEQGCSIDLDPRSWRGDACVQTLLGLVPVILQERGDAVRIFARASYASWLVDWLIAVST